MAGSTVPTSDVKADDSDSKKIDFTKMSQDELKKFLPYLSDNAWNKMKGDIDFNEIEYGVAVWREETIDALIDVFSQHGCHTEYGSNLIPLMIAEFGANLFDGEWFTTQRVFLYEREDHQLHGYFAGYILLGKIVDDQFIFHQYAIGKPKITLYGTLDPTGHKVSGYYFSDNQGRSEPQAIPLYRAKAGIYERALEAARVGDVKMLKTIKDLRKSFMNVDEQSESAFGYTILHQAVDHEQIGALKWIMTQRADLGLTNTFGQTPMDLAMERNNLEILKILENPDSVQDAADDSA